MKTKTEPYNRFEYQFGTNIDGYLITDRMGDYRIATCFNESNAAFIVKALNWYERARLKGDLNEPQ